MDFCELPDETITGFWRWNLLGFDLMGAKGLWSGRGLWAAAAAAALEDLLGAMNELNQIEGSRGQAVLCKATEMSLPPAAWSLVALSNRVRQAFSNRVRAASSPLLAEAEADRESAIGLVVSARPGRIKLRQSPSPA